MKDIQNLAAVIAPPANPRIVLGDPEWLDVFAKIGTRLPQDFVQFHKLYGDGYFYSLTHRTSANLSVYGGIKSFSFERFVPARLTELRLSKEKRPKSVPFPLYWEPGGLLPWGKTTNGVDLCWAVRGELVDNWPIVAIRPSTSESECFEMSMAKFLTYLITGKCSCKFMPKGFPGEKGVAFEVWPFAG